MATYQELIAQRAALDKQRAELEKALAAELTAHRAGIIAQIKDLMAGHGLTVADLESTSKPARGPKPKAEGDPARKVAAKYRDPATGASWSGRGLKPKWLSAALAEGKTLNDFAV